MGLDITAWKIARPLTPDERNQIPAENPQDWWYEKHGDTSEIHKPYTEFPATADGLAALDYVVCEGETLDFRAGSYSGYNEWRNDLAKMLGYSATEKDWRVPASGPFVELIRNSDCDSIIGPSTCAKLAQDFDTYVEKFTTFAQSLEYPVGYWIRKYQSWRDAFTLAAHTGCVVLNYQPTE